MHPCGHIRGINGLSPWKNRTAGIKNRAAPAIRPERLSSICTSSAGRIMYASHCFAKSGHYKNLRRLGNLRTSRRTVYNLLCRSHLDKARGYSCLKKRYGPRRPFRTMQQHGILVHGHGFQEERLHAQKAQKPVPCFIPSLVCGPP